MVKSPLVRVCAPNTVTGGHDCGGHGRPPSSYHLPTIFRQLWHAHPRCRNVMGTRPARTWWARERFVSARARASHDLRAIGRRGKSAMGMRYHLDRLWHLRNDSRPLHRAAFTARERAPPVQGARPPSGTGPLTLSFMTTDHLYTDLCTSCLPLATRPSRTAPVHIPSIGPFVDVSWTRGGALAFPPWPQTNPWSSAAGLAGPPSSLRPRPSLGTLDLRPRPSLDTLIDLRPRPPTRCGAGPFPALGSTSDRDAREDCA